MGLGAALQRAFLRFHAAVYQGSNGLLGHRMIGVPSLLLATTGRRSGRRRVNPLVYARDGAAYVLVASNSGSDQPPAWWLNLKVDPRVEVQVGRARRLGRATPVHQGEPEYERLWQLANANNHNRYRSYQSQTKRPIPLVVVTPD